MNGKFSDKRVKFSIWYVLAMVLVMTLLQTLVVGPLLNQQTELTYSAFKAALREGEIASVSVGQERISGTYEDGEAFYTVPVENPDLLQELEAQEVEVKGEVSSDGGLLGGILGWILPLALMAAFWYWMMGRMRGGAGGGSSIFSFGKSKARVIQGEQTGVRFSDVGGAAQAIVELREVTDFLKDPQRFQRLGGRMPRGGHWATPGSDRKKIAIYSVKTSSRTGWRCCWAGAWRKCSFLAKRLPGPPTTWSGPPTLRDAW